MKINWQPLDLSNIPTSSGVYAFKDGDQWLYVGKAQNLSKRLGKRHVPLRIALDLFPDVTLLYCPLESPHRAENYLIRELQPEWNGKTSRGCQYPACFLPEEFAMTPEQRKRAVSVIGF